MNAESLEERLKIARDVRREADEEHRQVSAEDYSDLVKMLCLW